MRQAPASRVLTCLGRLSGHSAVSRPHIQLFNTAAPLATSGSRPLYSSLTSLTPAWSVCGPQRPCFQLSVWTSLSRSATATFTLREGVVRSLVQSMPAASQLRTFYSSPVRKSLDEFFVSFPELDNQKNPIYPAVGRAWRTDELRQKSFDDLHKLWWILLKERNSLQIERHNARAKGAMIINPSRIRKVRLSMNRIKVVLGERKRMLGVLKRQARREEEEKAMQEGGGVEEQAEFEYPASLTAHPYLAPQKPRKGAQRKRWRKFVKKDPYHSK